MTAADGGKLQKSFSLNAKILILMELTSSLSEKEVDVLFDTVRDLKKQEWALSSIKHIRWQRYSSFVMQLPLCEMENWRENVSQLNVQESPVYFYL